MPGAERAGEYLYSRTSTGLPVNVTVCPSVWPASSTSIVRLAGGSMRDPGASVKRQAAAGVLPRDGNPHELPLAIVEAPPIVLVDAGRAVSAGINRQASAARRLGSSTYCLTGPIGMIAPART